MTEPAVEIGDEIEISPEDRGELEQQAAIVAQLFNDPARVAEWVARWIRQNLPKRVSSALWVTATAERDKGIAVELRTMRFFGDRLKVQLSGLLGAVSAGLALSTPIVSTPSVTVSAGAGAVVRFADLRKVEPVLVFTVKF